MTFNGGNITEGFSTAGNLAADYLGLQSRYTITIVSSFDVYYKSISYLKHVNIGQK